MVHGNTGRSVWEGSLLGNDRRLVVSVDIGTTFTATSFCILQRNKVPKFEEILRWPKQATPDAKVPSIVYYDEYGIARAFGAETEDEEIVLQAQTENWHKVEWWKLQLRPDYLPIINGLSLPALPEGLTVEKILADFLRYTMEQVKIYITATYGDGVKIWDMLFPSMYIVLTTPNGWEGSQQNKMRQAAVAAGIVDAEGGRRVRFVTEAEAAMLYAADCGSVNDWLETGVHIILCDCGGGTIDIAGYKIQEVKPLKLEEYTAARCYLAGAIFVAVAAEAFLKDRLTNTPWDNEDALNYAVHEFDRGAKKKFEDPKNASWVNLGGYQNVIKAGITRGKLKISGKDMASFFEPAVRSIITGLENMIENGDCIADKVILVGGLASSPYVFSKLVEWGKENGLSVIRPDGPTVKAVANGALAWYIDNTVASRLSKYHYGIRIHLPYDREDKEMVDRTPCIDRKGRLRVNGGWSCVVEKNCSIGINQEFIRRYSVEISEDSEDFEHEVAIFAYRRAKPLRFMTSPNSQKMYPGYEKICTVSGDLQRCFLLSPQMISITNTVYREVSFQVCIVLGDTEISARLRWKEGGEIVYGPANVSYD